MAFRCTQCNGSMVFDIASQQMKCQHCGSTCAPRDFRFRDAAVSALSADAAQACPRCSAPLSDADWARGECPYCACELPEQRTAGALAIFLCQNCGAELESTEDSLIGLCPYCGTQSMVRDTNRAGSAVERIIPFKITRERCGELYAQFSKKVRYLPRDFKNAQHLQSFTGIYMPYYEYDADLGEASLTGTKTAEKHMTYDVINTYSVPLELKGPYLRGTPFDGSRYLDDEISRRAMPFDTTQEVAFHPGYLSGFYADASTVDPELYKEDARKQAERDVMGEAEAKIAEAHDIKLQPTSRLEATVTDHHSVLFPLWFLTWRKGERVAYAVINGVSGKVVSDLPLDLRAFWLGCGKLALVIFLLLELLIQPTPQLTSCVSLGAALCMGIGIVISTKSAYEKQMHVHDKGWTAGQAPPKPPEQKPSKDGWKLKGCLLIFGICALIALIPAIMVWKDDSSMAPYLMVITPAYTLFSTKRVLSWQESLREKDGGAAILLLLATVVINVAILLISPASDLWYYAGDALCIAGLVASSFGMLRMYNVSTTRPLPRLFDRGEV